MKSKPPILNKLSDKESENKKDFVSDATKHVPLQSNLDKKNNLLEQDKNLPWNHEMVRNDVSKLFNLRLSEPDWLKLKYLADSTGESMHNICLDILLPSIYRKLKKIINDKK